MATTGPAKKSKRTLPVSKVPVLGPTGLISPQAIQAAAKKLELPEIDQEAASFVATTVEYHLREILEDAIKLQNQSKRHSLTVDDLNFVMRLRGQQPLYGYGAGAAATQEVTTTDGEQATVVLSGLGERKETLVRAMQTELPKVPREVGLLLHWLAVDGVQPRTPSNPSPPPLNAPPAPLQVEGNALVVPEASHPLSQELWLYYKKLVQSLMSPATPEAERRAYYVGVGTETGLHELVPYLSLHIHNTVTAAVGAGGRGSLDPLWAVMRVFRCMVVNPHMHLDLYLHQMLPGVMTVIANNRLGSHGEGVAGLAASKETKGGRGADWKAGNGWGQTGGDGAGDHYALRSFAAQTLAMLVRKYSGVYRPLASVICKTFAERVDEFLSVEPPDKGALATLYGTIVGIRHLGVKPVEVVLIPVAGQLLERLKGIMEDRGVKLRKRMEAQHCYTALVPAVGEAREREVKKTLSAERVVSFGEVGVKVELNGEKNEGGRDGKTTGLGITGDQWEGRIGAEAFLPYAAQSLCYPELLLVL